MGTDDAQAKATTTKASHFQPRPNYTRQHTRAIYSVSDSYGHSHPIPFSPCDHWSTPRGRLSIPRASLTYLLTPCATDWALAVGKHWHTDWLDPNAQVSRGANGQSTLSLQTVSARRSMAGKKAPRSSDVFTKASTVGGIRSVGRLFIAS